MLKRLKNNKGDAEPLFFICGIVLALILLWFALDIINLTWSRYTIRREAQTMSRLYALDWVSAVWDPDCHSSTMSACEYPNFEASKLHGDFIRITESAISNARLSDMNIMITDNEDATLADCDTQLLCIRATPGATTVRAASASILKTRLNYGTDLYITVEATAPYRYIGDTLGIRDPVYTVKNKFASERFSKDDMRGGH